MSWKAVIFNCQLIHYQRKWITMIYHYMVSLQNVQIGSTLNGKQGGERRAWEMPPSLHYQACNQSIQLSESELWSYILALWFQNIIMPASQSALQPWVSLGLLYNQSPPGVRFLNKIIFYRVGLLAPCPTPILEESIIIVLIILISINIIFCLLFTEEKHKTKPCVTVNSSCLHNITVCEDCCFSSCTKVYAI
jgi:hypothetical protein